MRTLPDLLRKGLKLVVVGFNPGERSAKVGHYYAGRGNTFWPLLYESGLVPEPFDYEDDSRLLMFGIGLTDLVKRPTSGIEDVKREEWLEGRVLLAKKFEEFSPRTIAFNGKITYERFAGRECGFGLQKEVLYGARIFVAPSTSAQNAIGKGVKLRYFRQLARLVNGPGAEAKKAAKGEARV